MAKPKIFVGLEIGTTKVCMVVGEVKADASVKILGMGTARSVGVRKGEIVDYANVRACVKTTLLEAEDMSDVEINGVFLAVTGAHLTGVNQRGTYRLNEGEREISPVDVEGAKEMARDIELPNENVILNTVVRQFWVDGNESTVNPVGLIGQTVDADLHIVHGVRTRVQNSIKCVREIPLDVEDVVFAPIASAQVALDRDLKQAGALVIDMGGGTTDYVLYIEGAIAASGCIPVGGDHITNDIFLVTQIPHAKAELLKRHEGDASADPANSIGQVQVPDETGHTTASVDRALLNNLIRGRLEETLMIIERRLKLRGSRQLGAGVFLTGGASRMRGFGELTKEVFDAPVFRPEPPSADGVSAYYEDPQYSTVIGLLRYAQILEEEQAMLSSGNFISRLWKNVWPFGKV